MRRLFMVFSIALVVLLPATAFGLTLLPRPKPQLGFYVEQKGWSGESRVSHQTISRPYCNANGTRLYCVTEREMRPGRWDAAIFGLAPGGYLKGHAVLNYGSGKTLAVVPAPDESRLLLLLEDGETTRLAVAEPSGKVLQQLAEGLDPERSQFVWSHEGKFIYCTVPAGPDKKMSLKRVTPDGKTHKTLMKEDVVEFDAARKADRVVALAFGSLYLIESGEVTQTFESESPIEGLRVSPDGTKVAWGGRRLVVFGLESGTVVARTKAPEGEPATDHRPAWSGDSKRVVFERVFRLGGSEGPILSTCLIFFEPARGLEQELERKNFIRNHIEWSPAGNFVFYDYMDIGAHLALSAKSHEPTELVAAPRLAAWTHVDGPSGGEVRAYAVAPSDGRIVYAYAAGLHVSEDAGKSWRRVKMQAGKRFQGRVSDIEVDRSDPRIVFVAAGNKLWCSEDGGSSWVLYCPSDKEASALNIAVHPTKPGLVYGFRGGRRVVRFETGRVTLLKEFKGDPRIGALIVDRRNPDLLVLSDHFHSKQVAVFSTDGGRSWRKATPPAGEKGILFLAGDADYKELLLALTLSGSVYFSTDAGMTWELHKESKEPGPWTDIVRESVREAFPLPAGKPEKGWFGDPLTAVRDEQNPKRVYVIVCGKGLYRSDDGGRQWQSANKGLGKRHFSHIAAVPGRPGRLVVGGYRALMMSNDGCQSWKASGVPPGCLGNIFDLAAHPDVRDLMFISSVNCGVCRSTDGGESWEKRVGSCEDFGIGWGWRFSFDSTDRDHVIGYAQSGVLESTDGGKNWKVVSKFQPFQRKRYHYQIVGDGEIITMCERANWRLLQSRDLGRTWRTMRGPFIGWRTMALASRYERPGMLYLATEYDAKAKGFVLWVSENSGETWEARPMPELFAHPTVIACNSASPEMLAIGFDDGTVWISFDDGKEWRDLGAGLPKSDVEALAFSPDDNRLYAKIERGSLYWIELLGK